MPKREIERGRHGRAALTIVTGALFATATLMSTSGCRRTEDPAHVTAPATATPPPTPPPATDEFPLPPAAPDARDEARTNDALVVAADAAERAATGTDVCETAHNQLIAMLSSVSEELGQDVHRPDRAEFVEVCREMPQAARRCIMPTYAMAHQEDCTTALEALPDDLRQRFHSVVNGPDAD